MVPATMGEVRLAVRRVEYDDGGWYEGSVDANGDEHGHGTEFYGNGNPQYTGRWKNGAREGYGTEFYEDGNPLFVGWWKKDKREGYGTEFYEDGYPLFVGWWKKDMQNINQGGTYYSEDGRRLECHRGSDMCTIYRSGPT